jgi:hypothetical protein
MKRIDLTGQVFGRLTVQGYSHTDTLPSGQKRAMWNAICSCGNKSIISSSNLSVTKSCGCLKKEGLNKKPFGVASFNGKYGQYKTGARIRKLPFLLSKEEFLSIVEKPCFYCGAEKTTKMKIKNCNGHFESNGIDRIDSAKGYFLENCVPCCPTCNTMKLDLSPEQFYAHIQKILLYARKV